MLNVINYTPEKNHCQLDLQPGAQAPTDATIRQAVRDALQNTDPLLVDIVSSVVDENGKLNVVLRTVTADPDDTNIATAELVSPTFLEALADNLGGSNAASSQPPTPAPGAAWSPFSTVRFGTTDSFTEDEFIAAVLDVLGDDTDSAVHVEGLVPSPDGGATDIVFAVSTRDGTDPIVFDQSFNERVRDRLFAGKIPTGQKKPAVQSMPTNAVTTEPAILVLSGGSLLTAEQIEAAIQEATESANVLGEVLGIIYSGNGDVEVSYRTVLPDDGTADLETVTAELESSNWMSKLGQRLNLQGGQIKPKASKSAPVGTKFAKSSFNLGFPADDVDPTQLKQLITDLIGSGSVKAFDSLFIAPGEDSGTIQCYF